LVTEYLADKCDPLIRHFSSRALFTCGAC